MMAAGKDPSIEIAKLQAQIEKLRRRLYLTIRSACPGPHHPQQHRDGKPPWCAACGRTSTGHRADEIKSMMEIAKERREQQGGGPA